VQTSSGLSGLSELRDKRVVVVGLGASGIAAARLCRRLGARVTANDGKPLAAWSPEARALEGLGIALAAGDHASARLDEADLVVVSPGVPSLPEVVRAEARGVPIWGEVELAVRSMETPAPVVAIGGTNGKSTTTSLVGALLEAAGKASGAARAGGAGGAGGKNVFVGGNLGEPLASHTEERFDALVLEVSSFQMERVDAFHPFVCALLNVTDDHLDRYPSFAAYAHAKGNAFLRQTDEDWAVIPADDDVCRAEARRGHGRIVTFGPGGSLDITDDAVVDRRAGERYARADMALTGGHNAKNVAAAIACAVPFGVAPDTIRNVLATFRGLPHRTALVAEHGGVRFYDDSKGTNVGAAVTALLGLVEPRAVLIAGGRDKGGTYGPLAEALCAKGRAVVVLGEAANAIAAAIGDRLPVRHAGSMREAVRLGASLAEPGDAVLLSPACSSFDMFRDYKDRGDQFVAAVRELVGPAAGARAPGEGAP
jgi:UDP-N-acetylmuramoylalanine--D-glutamate ligase